VTSSDSFKESQGSLQAKSFLQNLETTLGSALDTSLGAP
jgi:hypothetical protein